MKRFFHSPVFKEIYQILYNNKFYDCIIENKLIDELIDNNIKYIPINDQYSCGITDKGSLTSYIYLKTRLFFDDIEHKDQLSINFINIMNDSLNLEISFHEGNHLIYATQVILSNFQIPILTPRKK